ncbi:MAG: hypothetical protein ACREBW_01465 [Candidatus Micrarchaeaceae archaeon]
MNFDRRIAIPIALIAGFIMFYHIYNIYAGLALLACVAVLVFMRTIDYYINDGRKLWNYARATPAGTFTIPNWEDIYDTLSQEWHKGLFFCIYTYNGKRAGLVLNSHISPQISVINKRYNTFSNILSASDWRDITMNEAYETIEKKTLADAIRIVNANGGRIDWKKRKKGNAVESDDDD